LWVPSLRVASSGQDLHLLASAHAGRTKQKRRPHCWNRRL
jgi:hypothetical protein